MTYRPYPSPVRARHQVGRHVHPAPTMTGLEALRAWSVSGEQFAARVHAALRGFGAPAPSDPGSSR